MKCRCGFFSFEDHDWERLARYVGGEADVEESENTRRWIEADPTGERQRLRDQLAETWAAAAADRRAWNTLGAWRRIAGQLEQPAAEKLVIMFDGVCNLCNALVRFVISRDPAERFVFAPLQSASSRELLRRYAASEQRLDLQSVLVIENGRVLDRSSAILAVIRRLHGPWKLASALLLVPRPIRDLLYDWVARRRYGWFGRMDVCPLPTPEMAARFLAD